METLNFFTELFKIRKYKNKKIFDKPSLLFILHISSRVIYNIKIIIVFVLNIPQHCTHERRSNDFS